MTICCFGWEKLFGGRFVALVLGLGFYAWGMVFGCPEPMITEFLARNGNQSTDDDGDRSDWIELHNPDLTDVDLEGWSLTDDRSDLTKWIFPSILLGPNQYLVVYASGKDRRELGAPLHTNFRLNSEGEYLGLVDPRGDVVFEFDSQYPAQSPDVSFGQGRLADSEIVVMPSGAPARALIPRDGQLATNWTQVEFDDGDWMSGRTGVGYDYGGLIGLDVQKMRGVNSSVYVRVPFELESLPKLNRLILRFRYEDGFVAYLNGERIGADNAPASLSWNSRSTADRPDAEALVPADIDISAAKELLRAGTNVLAVHGLNQSLGNSDILIQPELIAIEANEERMTGFMYSPSPGMPNRSAVHDVLEPPIVLIPSQVFVGSLSVSVAMPGSNADGVVIRYTLDGTVPSEESGEYVGPLNLRRTTQLRVRAFGLEGSVSPVVSASFIQAHAEIADFTSDLPLIVLENFRSGRPPQNAFQAGFMAVIEKGRDGRSTLGGELGISTRVGLKVRGSSTAGRSKPSLSLEAWDESDNGRGIAPLGLPKDPDWILWGPYNFDLTLMHNPFMYELSNQIGRYAPRTRFVEVFLNTGGGALRSSDYFGVYALTEKIKRDDDRVHLDQLFPEHDREPGITGGYLLKIDRADPGDSGFRAAGQTLRYVYPKEKVIKQRNRDAQETYLRTFFTEMGRALNRGSFRDPERGYAKFIDVDAAIDHHLLNVLAFNVDAFRLSGYMSIPRNGKLVFGPIWDFDRSLGSTDGRDNVPNTWQSQSGTDFFNYPWWNRMFQDIDFFQKYIDRFQSLRRDKFSEANINAIIDGMADELREAQARNLDRWNQRPRSRYGGTYQGEVDHMKDWLADRSRFMERQFVDPPVIELVEGEIGARGAIVVTSAEGGEIYFTLDGTDPRKSGGDVADSAQRYMVPISLTESAVVTARVRNLDHTSLTGANNPPLSSKWSGPVSVVYSVDQTPRVGDLQVVELSYHPRPPTVDELRQNSNLRARDFEFIELWNQSDRQLELAGVQVAGGVSYAFPVDQLNLLAPGQTVILVGQREAFELRYGMVDALIAEYRGALDDDADEIVILGADGQELTRASYVDEWYPATDGHGFSLVRSPESDPFVSRALNWGISSRVGGDPGENEAFPGRAFSVRINEVLNNSEPPAVDVVELVNDGDQATSVGGWFLTDDLRIPGKFRIQEGTVIEPGGFLVLDENVFGTSPDGTAGFRLSSLGEEVYLFATTATGEIEGYADGFRFRALSLGDTQGPWIGSDGRRHIVQFQMPTLGQANSEPLVGPVVITEIFAAPTKQPSEAEEANFEFVEIVNISADTVAFRDTERRDAGWRFRGGVQFDFPSEMSMVAGERVLVVSFDPNANESRLMEFRNQWEIPDSVVVVGPFSGRLENSGEELRLERPDSSLLSANSRNGAIPYLLVDQVHYSDSLPWPQPDSIDESLQRVAVDRFGDDPSNWFYAHPSPGEALVNRQPVITISAEGEGVQLEIELNVAGVYSVQRSGELGEGAWEEFEIIRFSDGAGAPIIVRDEARQLNQRFYRVVPLL
ncbi:MAG: hypothetical protein M2R45_03414 [Verrucomicrobia subdivision 3 bacterium]|nr:hypothetical protein [Limisphaerales bacterium]MCS1416319.1 hypothetical protein [Limisphaerales bacterium]